MGAGGCTDNLSIQGTKQFGVKVAWVWTTSKGTELQRDRKDLIMRQFFVESNHKRDPLLDSTRTSFAFSHEQHSQDILGV